MPTAPTTYRPYVIEKDSYDVTGAFVSFDDPTRSGRENVVGFSILVSSGTALIAMNGDPAGPFIELSSGGTFGFDMESPGIYVKAASGTTDVQVVAAIYGED